MLHLNIFFTSICAVAAAASLVNGESIGEGVTGAAQCNFEVTSTSSYVGKNSAMKRVSPSSSLITTFGAFKEQCSESCTVPCRSYQIAWDGTASTKSYTCTLFDDDVFDETGGRFIPNAGSGFLYHVLGQCHDLGAECLCTTKPPNTNPAFAPGLSPNSPPNSAPNSGPSSPKSPATNGRDTPAPAPTPAVTSPSTSKAATKLVTIANVVLGAIATIFVGAFYLPF